MHDSALSCAAFICASALAISMTLATTAESVFKAKHIIAPGRAAAARLAATIAIIVKDINNNNA